MKDDALDYSNKAGFKKIAVVANEDEWRSFAASIGAEAVGANFAAGMEDGDSEEAVDPDATDRRPQDGMKEEEGQRDSDAGSPSGSPGTLEDAISPSTTERERINKFILKTGRLNLQFSMMTYAAAMQRQGSQSGLEDDDMQDEQSLTELMTDEGMHQVIFVGTEGKDYQDSKPCKLAAEITQQLTLAAAKDSRSSLDLSDVDTKASKQLTLNSILLLTLPQPGLSLKDDRAEKSGLTVKADIFQDFRLVESTSEHPARMVTHMSLNLGDANQFTRHFLKQQCMEDLEGYRRERAGSDKKFSGSIFGCPRPVKIEAVNALLASLEPAQPQGDMGPAMGEGQAQRGFFAKRQMKRALGQGRLGEIVEQNPEFLDDAIKTDVITRTFNG